MQLVRDVRIPRVICTAFVGGLLGITGAMMQGVTRNPVAEPSLMGITQGATFAIALVGASSSLYGLLGNTLAAFIGALVSGLLVLGFSMKSARNMNMSRLLLAGTALSTFFISMATVIALLTNKSQNLAFWISGGFRATTWESVQLVIIVGGIATIISLFLAPKINIVLGEMSIGIDKTRRSNATMLQIPRSCGGCGEILRCRLIGPYLISRFVIILVSVFMWATPLFGHVAPRLVINRMKPIGFLLISWCPYI